MKKLLRQSPGSSAAVTFGRNWVCAVLIAVTAGVPGSVRAADGPTTFATPEEAAASLGAAANAQNRDALRSLFGPAIADIENPDPVQGTYEVSVFSAAFNVTHRLTLESKEKYVLEVGTNSWPFPIPIVQRGGRWSFDTAAGREELLNRRIGRNELEVLKVIRAYVDAQREYASRDRDGDQVLEYARQLASTAGAHDGLYWPPDADSEISPLGPLVAEAQARGYRRRSTSGETGPQPFHGYYFKILTRQGRAAPGGAYDYVINGNMIGGFALVAWPVEYGESGVMTFIVNQQGRVHQRDLGAKTARLVGRMKSYNPESGWAVSPD